MATPVERLDVFVGTWEMEAVFPAAPGQTMRGGQTVFEWLKGQQLLVGRSTMPVPEVPDSIAIVAPDPASGGYLQHYFDSRGVIRLYSMALEDGRWTLLRTKADFSPLDFSQRFTGTFSADRNSIRGAWETSHDGQTWTKDFDLGYLRVS